MGFLRSIGNICKTHSLRLIFLDEQQWLPESNSARQSIGTLPNKTAVTVRGVSPTAHRVLNTLRTSLTVYTPTSLLSKRLVHHLNERTFPGMHILNLGSFLNFVPSRLGHSEALDDAVQCICTAYSSLRCENRAVLEGRREYSKALKSLRKSVQDTDTALSSNVLCAAVLLSWYEVGLTLLHHCPI